MDLSRPIYYDEPGGQPIEEMRFVERIKKICAEWPSYGYSAGDGSAAHLGVRGIHNPDRGSQYLRVFMKLSALALSYGCRVGPWNP